MYIDQTPFQELHMSSHRLVQTGNLLLQKGDRRGAIVAFREAASLRPGDADILVNLGVLLFEDGAHQEAMECQERALQLEPTLVEALNNLGIVLRADGRLAEAQDVLRQAIALHAEFGPAYYNLGNVYFDRGDLIAAEGVFRTATRLLPASPAVWTNLGLTRYRMGNVDPAIACYRQALALQPDFVDAHWNLSHALLLRGDRTQGWAEFEWRWNKPEFRALRDVYPYPSWDGRDMAGGTVLVFAEQGFGDLFQFARYLPALARRNLKMLVEVPAAAAGLMRATQGPEAVIVRGEEHPRIDACCGLASLPHLLGSEGEEIPPSVPYLRVPDQNVFEWREKLAGCARSFRVGIVWSGSATNPAGQYRSMHVEQMLPLLQLNTIQIFSLQKGEPGRELAQLAGSSSVIDWSDDLKDFSDTAALIQLLDLVISIDTGVAHLAGALGKQCWTMVPNVPDWRWQADGIETPWYPTMRLYHQQRSGDWATVIQRVVDDLHAMRGGGVS
jgi:tetratricopeptide (TPR) repeat protein